MDHIGIVTGGTFTDAAFIDEDGQVATVETPTTADLLGGIVTGVERLCDDTETAPGDRRLRSHGMTVALDALMEKGDAETALITTEGSVTSLNSARSSGTNHCCTTHRARRRCPRDREQLTTRHGDEIIDILDSMDTTDTTRSRRQP